MTYQPSAFPGQPYGINGLPSGYYEPGMTLRDWFAGQPLAGLLANRFAFDAHFQGDPNAIAFESGRFADAMLA